jgi:prepilin-type N-terminal cleavage/methylation domain-containing protein
MATSQSLLKVRRQRGFSLLEAVLAIVILTVGLLGAAALMAQMAGTTVQSRYMSTESLLASEKLDDLNRYLNSDQQIAVTKGLTAGSLAGDVTDNVTVNGNTETVKYFDDVQISSGSGNSAGAGAMEETVSGIDPVTGNQQWITTVHRADGTVTSVTAANPPASATDTLVFKRRWMIEKDVPVVGAYRITVLITLQNTIQPATFQSSMVRQGL